jgi:hypothetical protein
MNIPEHSRLESFVIVRDRSGTFRIVQVHSEYFFIFNFKYINNIIKNSQNVPERPRTITNDPEQ